MARILRIPGGAPHSSISGRHAGGASPGARACEWGCPVPCGGSRSRREGESAAIAYSELQDGSGVWRRGMASAPPARRGDVVLRSDHDMVASVLG
ncbi:unnamed protein product [Boreogadus saida]